MVHQGSVSRDGCKLETLDLGDRTHVAIDAYNMIGAGKDYSIIALNNGTVSCVVSDNYGYVYMNDEGDILLDVEFYNGMYVNILLSKKLFINPHLCVKII